MVEEMIAQIQGTAFPNRARSCVKIKFQSDNQTTQTLCQSFFSGSSYFRGETLCRLHEFWKISNRMQFQIKSGGMFQ